jgi:hypothetical protein
MGAKSTVHYTLLLIGEYTRVLRKSIVVSIDSMSLASLASPKVKTAIREETLAVTRTLDEIFGRNLSTGMARSAKCATGQGFSNYY